MGWSKNDIDNVSDMWDLFDIIRENSEQNCQATNKKEPVQTSVHEETDEEKRVFIEKGKTWLKRAKDSNMK